MSKDYYKTLGVDKNASPDDIKKAFRKLAHEHHPDKNKGDDKKFKEVNEAYQTLSDKNKRAQYDQFGSNGPQFGGGGNPFGGGAGGFNWEDIMRQAQQGGGFQHGEMEFDISDLFGAFGFGGARPDDPFGRGQRVKRGRNVQTEVKLTFKESIQGVKKTVEIPDLVDGHNKGNKKLNIEIPAGVENGEQLKMADAGEQVTGGRAGSLYIVIHVEKHKTFRKEGLHIVMDLPVKLVDAILGTKVQIETLDGVETVEIPAGLQIGQEIRIRGKGVRVGVMRSGDLIIQTHIEIPKKLSKEGRDLIEKLRKEGL